MTAILKLDHISQYFGTAKKPIKAVDDVSLELEAGKVLCLVGESGCGKTTTGKMAAGILQPTAGRVTFEGKDPWRLTAEEAMKYRLAVQYVHQDPYTSLNPSRTIGDALSAPLLYHRVCTPANVRTRMIELLELVDLTPAAEIIDKYPHQLSGGQRQRVSVARSLTVNPRLLVADEAVSMVDVSIRASLLNTLSGLGAKLGTTFLFITHDLAVARYFAWDGHIAVMYLGQVVEYGRTPDLLGRPMHPYTQALLGALPEADPKRTRTKERLQLRSPDVPSLLALPRGCYFHPRCPQYLAGVCDRQQPRLQVADDAQQVACHLAKPGGES